MWKQARVLVKCDQIEYNHQQLFRAVEIILTADVTENQFAGRNRSTAPSKSGFRTPVECHEVKRAGLGCQPQILRRVMGDVY